MEKKDNSIFIGKKPSISYVNAAVTQFNKSNEIVIKARGKAISKAVDVAEIVRNRFVQGAKAAISIGTEEITADKEKISISTIEITMKK